MQRAYVLEFIDETRRTSLFKQVSARGWRRAEPVQVHPETPMLLPKLLARRYRHTSNPYHGPSAELGLPPMILRSLIPPPSPSAATEGSVVPLTRS
jgi:hypothetical protein